MSFDTLDEVWKTSSTASHVYFVSGPFSQWWPCKFSAQVPGAEARGFLRFNCAEQFMMAGKAALFGDDTAFDAIMASKVPAEQKRLGRKVAGFDGARWDAAARDIVVAGNMAKFGQESDLAAVLLATSGKTLVEGAHYDPVWGVALAWNDPAILDQANWQGTNWLGQCLMTVRERLRDEAVERLKRG